MFKKHLMERAGVFYFRRVLPSDVLPFFPTKEIQQKCGANRFITIAHHKGERHQNAFVCRRKEEAGCDGRLTVGPKKSEIFPSIDIEIKLGLILQEQMHHFAIEYSRQGQGLYAQG